MMQRRIQDLWKRGGGGRESKFLDAAPKKKKIGKKTQKSAGKGGGGAAADSAPPPWIRHCDGAKLGGMMLGILGSSTNYPMSMTSITNRCEMH